MSSLVAYNPKTKAWAARPSTVSKATTVIYIGPAGAPNPVSASPGVDLISIGGTVHVATAPPAPPAPPTHGYSGGYDTSGY